MGGILWSGAASAATYYVKPDGDDAAAGTSWNTALATVAKGFEKLNKDKTAELLVAAGTYAVKRCALTGPATAGSYATVRGATGNPADVVFDGGDDTNVLHLAQGVIVADLTIANGTNEGPTSKGAGIRAGSKTQAPEIDIIITNCLFTGCHNAKSDGAVLLCDAPNVRVYDTVFRNNTSDCGGALSSRYANTTQTVVNCRFEGNTAKYGAGIYASNVSLTCRDCVFSGNTASQCGGGAAVADGTRAVFDGCLFEKNDAPNTTNKDNYGGGGLFLLRQIADSFCAISNCVFSGNTAGIRAGGLGCSFHTNAYATVYGCVFTNNVAKGHGGGLVVYEQNNTHKDTPFTVRNCLFANNRTSGSGQGGGVYAVFYGILDSCTIVSNSSLKAGGGLYHRWGGTVTNCIIADNVIDGAPDDGTVYTWWLDKSGTIYRNCCFWPAPVASGASAKASVAFATANGCRTADPLFADAANGDFSLRPRSPCRNAGVTEDWMAAAFDLAGAPRVSEDVADIGCFEWRPIPGLTMVIR